MQNTLSPAPLYPQLPLVAFVGGGNIATALIGGLVGCGICGTRTIVIEPSETQRLNLIERYQVNAIGTPGEELRDAGIVVWAVKPQVFASAARSCRPWLSDALHLSVMAGIRAQEVSERTGSLRVARAIPNTAAAVGKGMSGLHAASDMDSGDRLLAETVMAATGRTLWVDRESDLDAVTAISGSGPAYFLYFVEAMLQAARELGLSPTQGRLLAHATLEGTANLLGNSGRAPDELRKQVTSPGGTTQAAMEVLEASDVKGSLIRAIKAAHARSIQMT